MSNHILLPNPIDDMTFGEWHSATIGLIGFYLGRANHPRVAALLALAAITGVQPGSKFQPIGWDNVIKEPWYFSAVLLGSYLAGEATR